MSASEFLVAMGPADWAFVSALGLIALFLIACAWPQKRPPYVHIQDEEGDL